MGVSPVFFQPLNNYISEEGDRCLLCHNPALQDESLVDHPQPDHPNAQKHWMHLQCALTLSQSAIDKNTTLKCLHCAQQIFPISSPTAQGRAEIRELLPPRVHAPQEVYGYPQYHMIPEIRQQQQQSIYSSIQQMLDETMPRWAQITLKIAIVALAVWNIAEQIRQNPAIQWIINALD